MGKRKHRNKNPRQGDRKPTSQDSALFDISDLDHHKAEHDTTKPNDDGNDKQQSGGNRVGFIKRWWQFVKDPKHASAVVAIFTVVIATTGIAYAIFAGLQWNAMSGQLDQMLNANRPFVLTMPTADKPATDFHSLSVTMHAYNVGVSPAVRVSTTDTHIGIDTDSGVADQIKQCSFTYKIGVASLSPNGSVSGINLALETANSRYISDDERDKFLIPHKEWIYVWGGIKYFGVRGGEYETKYCYRFEPTSITQTVYPWTTDCPCNEVK